MSGRVLAGRYELLEKKGDGGMAVVYKAKDTYLNRFVAIKILKPEFIRDNKFVDNFRRESQAAAKLSHPNIVSVFDVGKEGNIFYIVMELLDGDSLGDVIEREAPISEKRVIEITKQIAAGLSAAHRKNIIHRDIKPHNILMTEDGTPKITDFGIAKAVNNGTMVQSSSVVMGSVHYLSPEQAKGGNVDARSDIYSLGIVMYEMLTGTVPFDGDNAVSVAVMHVNNDVPAPSDTNLYVSSQMDAIVQKATRRLPEERFSSADEMIKALNGERFGVSRPSVKKETKVFSSREAAAAAALEAERKQRVSGTSGSGAQGSRPKTGSTAGRGSQSAAPAVDPDNDFKELDELKNSGRKRKKKDRDESGGKGGMKTVILAVLLALVCAVPLSLGVLHLLNGSGRGADIEIPAVAGTTQEQAVMVLENLGLKTEVGEQAVASETIEAGLVAATNPAEGTKVKKGSKVTIILSSGPPEPDVEMVTVPNVVEMSLADAKSKLKMENLTVGDIAEEYSDTIPEGYIVSQNPADGQVEAGTAVALSVSKGREIVNVKVPDLTGKTVAEAKNALEALGLQLGKMTEAEADEPEGTVINQGVSPGTSIQTGESVSIVVSKGPAQQKQKETTIDYTVDFSQAPDDFFDLTVTLTRSDGTLTHVVTNEKHSVDEGSVTLEMTGSGTGKVRVIMNGVQVDEDTVSFN
ncbi:MAG: Stk1 family PASTA domain-containing Ser/Thr kinase [Firmicutes bacterium]|nr:Stk1 family PASTA domain-containing Ser/Thr kinase [Bacillota bacterium]